MRENRSSAASSAGGGGGGGRDVAEEAWVTVVWKAAEEGVRGCGFVFL